MIEILFCLCYNKIIMKEIPLYRKIEQHYLERISNGELKHGDKLPTEYQMTDIFGVSRITVIKAMKELEKKGVIVRHTKTGTFVNCRNRNVIKQMIIPIVLPYNNLLNYDIILGAQKFALDNDAVIPFYNTFNNPETEREILLSIEHMSIDGLLFYPCSALENIDILGRMYRKKLPVVLLDRAMLGTNFPLVTSDNHGGMRRLVRYLLRKGYRRFGYYGVSKKLITTEKDRFDGFCSALFDSNVELNPDFLFEAEDDAVDKYRYATLDTQDESLIRSSRRVAEAIKNSPTPPEVICCTNDFNAVTLLKAVQEIGISVPDQLVITGFDGLSIARDATPAIPTVSQDFEALGRTALDTVCRMIAGETDIPAVQKIPTRQTRNDFSGEEDEDEE